MDSFLTSSNVRDRQEMWKISLHDVQDKFEVFLVSLSQDVQDFLEDAFDRAAFLPSVAR